MRLSLSSLSVLYDYLAKNDVDERRIPEFTGLPRLAFICSFYFPFNQPKKAYTQLDGPSCVLACTNRDLWLIWRFFLPDSSLNRTEWLFMEWCICISGAASSDAVDVLASDRRHIINQFSGEKTCGKDIIMCCLTIVSIATELGQSEKKWRRRKGKDYWTGRLCCL